MITDQSVNPQSTSHSYFELALSQGIDDYDSSVAAHPVSRANGFSVRCQKDNYRLGNKMKHIKNLCNFKVLI
jgi:hypothetical protein